jgi:DNA-directed RNA polymerase specialized sigma24 family protein
MNDTLDLLAVLALRRWAYDRAVLRSARTTNYKTTGWQQRSNRYADARIVRVIDFERTLAMLTPTQQEILTLVYRHGHSCSEAAALMRGNAATLGYHLARARHALGLILDRRGIL